MATGKINVQADNIFPIIKQFLYSEQEIFLRELVSNAVDAIQKLSTLSRLDDFKGDTKELKVTVKLDKEKGILTVSDNGIGLTEDEVKKYITEVAFSGAEDFINKYKDKAEQIIGHFGLGFYSAFMVASEVEIQSKSYKKGPGSKAVHWSCKGDPEFVIEAGTRKERGTDVVLHMADDAKDYLESGRIREILNKYCKFLPVPLFFEDKQINDTEPAWLKKPAKLKDKDYNDFYRKLYPLNFEEPLFNIHLNVDYPFNLTGILYFPKIKDKLDVQRDKIQLYCSQVFVTESVEGIVPDFLTLLHGVLDSPDIPLNVSRSYLQGDPNVKKISAHISKKVSDKLAELFKKDRKDFESKWDDIRIFIEYGILTDEKFAERSKSFMLYKDTGGKYHTFDEMKKTIGKKHTDKDGRLVVLYTNDTEAQHIYIKSANDKGYTVIELTSPLTGHLVGKLEQANEKTAFARVDADTLDKLIPKKDSPESNLSEDQQKELTKLFENVVDKETFTVSFASLDEDSLPVSITTPEFTRRMKEMSAVGGMNFGGEMPLQHNLVVNGNHPLISKMLLETDAKKQDALAHQACDLAMLSQNMLKGEKLDAFIRRSIGMIGK